MCFAEENKKSSKLWQEARDRSHAGWSKSDEEAVNNAIVNCEKCAAEHRQLALWLRELKAYRQAWKRIPKEIKKKILNTGDLSKKYGYYDSLEIIKRNLDELMEGFDG